jgi:GTP pyrophosphokinase
MDMHLFGDILVESAMALSYSCHKDQYDKQGIPYIFHPYSVAMLIAEDEEYIKSVFPDLDITELVVIALLHDVIEDCEDGEEKIKYYFQCTGKVLDTVKILTRSKDETYFDYIKRVSLDSRAAIVKYFDLLHNINRGRIAESLYERYDKALQILKPIIKK